MSSQPKAPSRGEYDVRLFIKYMQKRLAASDYYSERRAKYFNDLVEPWLQKQGVALRGAPLMAAENQTVLKELILMLSRERMKGDQGQRSGGNSATPRAGGKCRVFLDDELRHSMRDMRSELLSQRAQQDAARRGVKRAASDPPIAPDVGFARMARRRVQNELANASLRNQHAKLARLEVAVELPEKLDVGTLIAGAVTQWCKTQLETLVAISRHRRRERDVDDPELAQLPGDAARHSLRRQPCITAADTVMHLMHAPAPAAGLRGMEVAVATVKLEAQIERERRRRAQDALQQRHASASGDAGHGRAT